MFAAHGYFEVTVQGRILHVVIERAWNLETALKYRQVIHDVIAPISGKPWAVLTDVSGWELFTPDCYPVISELINYCVEKGMCYEAIVNSGQSIKLQPFKTRQPHADNFVREFFTDQQSALAWLQQQGFE
ncbi:hypothetical protein [Aestuariibacter salexigens]|uniref:hypothetical protein n=1 Tax=Aestuariibacter salexigens TaxID=226010 RepID=UPI0003FBED56|nr:hypothetical protein [Aestuariibacter salexigens]